MSRGELQASLSFLNREKATNPLPYQVVNKSTCRKTKECPGASPIFGTLSSCFASTRQLFYLKPLHYKWNTLTKMMESSEKHLG